MHLVSEARRHVESDQVAWLTTVTRTGAPAPTPVWFVADGESLIIMSEPTARKIENIKRNPRVTLHFNSDHDGQDIVVIYANAAVEPNQSPAAQPGYTAKYAAAITRLGMTGQEFDRTSTTLIRLTPIRTWLGPP